MDPSTHLPFGQQLSHGGYRNEEVASALQKSIRRGRADDALFWATELDLSGFGEYVWKRLRIVASEDIGPADPAAALLIHALHENWKNLRRKDDKTHAPERLFLVHAVLHLAASAKSRQVDHALIVHYEGPRPRREIPDWALDRHTGRGRQKGRGWSHFFSEGARLDGSAPPDPYEARARQIRRDAGTQAEFPGADP